MVTSTNHVIAGRIYFVLGPWHFGDFRNNFLPNIGEDQKKSYDLSSGPLAGRLLRRVASNSQWGCFGDLGAEPPALENFAFFCNMNLILELF